MSYGLNSLKGYKEDCIGAYDRGYSRGILGVQKKAHMGGCQNYGPFLDPHYNTAPNI